MTMTRSLFVLLVVVIAVFAFATADSDSEEPVVVYNEESQTLTSDDSAEFSGYFVNGHRNPNIGVGRSKRSSKRSNKPSKPSKPSKPQKPSKPRTRKKKRKRSKPSKQSKPSKPSKQSKRSKRRSEPKAYPKHSHLYSHSEEYEQENENVEEEEEETTYPTYGPTLEPTSNPLPSTVIIDSTQETRVSIPDVIELIIPAFAFPDRTAIEVYVAHDEIQAAIFEETTILHRSISVQNLRGNQIYIVVDHSPLLDHASNQSLLATVHIPSAVIDSCPADYGYELFAAVEQGSDEEDLYEIYVLFDSEYNANGNTLTANLDAQIFIEQRASIIIACTPGINANSQRRVLMVGAGRQAPAPAQAHAQGQGRHLLAVDECGASSIACPVAGGCTVTSPFAKKRTINGVTRPHYGTDYRAAEGTTVTAAANGVIERSYKSTTFGETIVVRHSDGGATLYAHLSERLKKTDGESVQSGDIIGKSGNTGKSEGPHLHLEYVPNGIIFKSKNRIDPNACMDSTATGSITVGDSGSAADDSFSIAIDGYFIGETSVGAWNTMAVNNLVSGNHILTLTVTYAPDNVGTYTITLNDGLLFDDGVTSKSGQPPQGTVETWTIIVPQN